MPNNQVVAVWGSPGSGKTLTSVKIARELAKENNVILVLCDDETPMVPLLIPAVSASEKKSLGNLLTLPTMTQINVFQHFIPLGKSLSLLGYQRLENEMTYADYDVKRAKSLIDMLRHTPNYVVIDCSHHMLTNVLTAVALEVSDVVLRVVNADLKSLIYIESQKPYLQEPRFRYDQQITIINSVLLSQDTHPYEDAFGGHAYILPYLPSVKAQYDEDRLLETISSKKDAKRYEPVIQSIIKEKILNE